MCYYMIAAADKSLVFSAMTYHDWRHATRVWAELPSTKVTFPPVEDDYWWRGEFTMLRRNGYNDKLVNRFERITKDKID